MRPLGKRQRNLLASLAGVNFAVVVGDKLTAALVQRGLLTAEPDGSWAHITPAGLRCMADEIEAGRQQMFSTEQFKARNL